MTVARTFRLTLAERTKLRDLATARGWTLSEAVRACVIMGLGGTEEDVRRENAVMATTAASVRGVDTASAVAALELWRAYAQHRADCSHGGGLAGSKVECAEAAKERQAAWKATEKVLAARPGPPAPVTAATEIPEFVHARLTSTWSTAAGGRGEQVGAFREGLTRLT